MFHVRSSSPVLVNLPGGRQGLANPTWCGKIALPEGHKAAHGYNLAPAAITCPTCHHLYTCPASDPDAQAERCRVCEHLYGCVDKACRDQHHPGILPAPVPGQPEVPQ